MLTQIYSLQNDLNGNSTINLAVAMDNELSNEDAFRLNNLDTPSEVLSALRDSWEPKNEKVVLIVSSVFNREAPFGWDVVNFMPAIRQEFGDEIIVCLFSSFPPENEGVFDAYVNKTDMDARQQLVDFLKSV